jgi:RNA methyltransferase, TrmH family
MEHNTFIIEGEKLIDEMIHQQIPYQKVFATKDWINEKEINFELISDEELSKISTLQSPNKVLAILPFLSEKESNSDEKLLLYLDNIKDPGNMGTILRTADWYGVQQVYLSKHCVDIYNPKVVQSTMGSIFRINIKISTLESVKKTFSSHQIYGAVLDGDNINDTVIASPSILVIGSESHGISNESLSLLDYKIKIPNFGKAESLNASVASGILLHFFRENIELNNEA